MQIRKIRQPKTITVASHVGTKGNSKLFQKNNFANTKGTEELEEHTGGLVSQGGLSLAGSGGESGHAPPGKAETMPN